MIRTDVTQSFQVSDLLVPYVELVSYTHGPLKLVRSGTLRVRWADAARCQREQGHTSGECSGHGARTLAQLGTGRPVPSGMSAQRPYFSGMNARPLLAFIGITNWFAPAS